MFDADKGLSAMASLRAIASPTLGLPAAPTDALGRHAPQVWEAALAS
jgi:hypothetical protein